MTLPTLHKPQKDSPETYLAAGINDLVTTLTLNDSSIFQADNITRLTLGFDTLVTETVTVQSYGSGNQITVVRGTPAYSWPINTKVARVFTSHDLDEIQDAIDYLDTKVPSISTAMLQDGAVTSLKIATSGVEETNIKAGAVTNGKIGADAVDGTKIADNAINSEHIYSGAIDTVHIADYQITSDKIANSSVTETKLGTGAVTTTKIGDVQVTDEKISAVAMAKVTGLSTHLDSLMATIGFDPQFRLSLTSGNPTDLANSSSSGTIYYVPYKGNAIQLYNGTQWEIFNLAQLSLTLTATSGKNYDVFVDYNSGTPVFVLGTVWTNDSTRAVALAYQNGRFVESGNPARLYVGTIRANGTNTTIDTAELRGVYNFYNKIKKNCLFTTSKLTADKTMYWITGNPSGENIKIGIGASWTAGGSGEFAAAYLYSTLIPSAGNGHGEVGIYGLNGMAQVGKTWSLNFPTGYNYATADLKLYDTGCKSEYFNFYVEIWN